MQARVVRGAQFDLDERGEHDHELFACGSRAGLQVIELGLDEIDRVGEERVVGRGLEQGGVRERHVRGAD